MVLGFEELDLAPTYLINRFVELLHDVKAIKDVQGIRCLFLDYLEIRRPHITTDEFKCFAALFAKFMEETQERFGLSLHAAPEKPPGASIELIQMPQLDCL